MSVFFVSVSFYIYFKFNPALSLACIILRKNRQKQSLISIGLWSKKAVEELDIDVVLSVINELSKGLRPRDIEILVNNNVEISDNEKSALYFDLFKFYFHLDHKNYSKAQDISKRLEVKVRERKTSLTQEEQATFMMELLYSCYLQDNIIKARQLYEEITQQQLNYYPINMPRALASYHLLTTGNLQVAQLIYKKAYRQYNSVEKGLQQFEMNLARTHKFIT